MFNDTTFGSLSKAAKKLNDPAYAGCEKMAKYMKNRLEARPPLITAKTGDYIIQPCAVATYKFKTKQHESSVLLQDVAGKEHIHLRSAFDCFVGPFPHKSSRQ